MPKSNDTISEIRARIAKARAKLSKWATTHQNEIDALAAAKDADFLCRVQSALNADGAILSVEIPACRGVNMRTMEPVTIQARSAVVVRVHRGRKHLGIWVRLDETNEMQFIRARMFDNNFYRVAGIPYPASEKGDRR